MRRELLEMFPGEVELIDSRVMPDLNCRNLEAASDLVCFLQDERNCVNAI